MRILITGGAGFIGSHLAELAILRGHQVSVVDNMNSGHPEHVPKNAALERVDIRCFEPLLNVFRRFRPHAIAHLAAMTSVPDSLRNPQLDAAVNILGGLNVLEAARRTHTPQFVFASTGGAMYSDLQPGTRAYPNTLPSPLSAYGVSKLTFERYLSLYRTQHGFRSTVLRYSNVYGPRQCTWGDSGVVGIFISRLLRNLPLRIYGRSAVGDEGCVRDYVYVLDAARATLAAVEGCLPGDVLHVATGIGTTTLHLGRTLAACLHTTPLIQNAPPRAGDIPYSVLDPGDLPRHLGRPIPLHEGLKETARWFQEKVTTK
jgi:UDP-glucose 4-epimerase